MKRGADIFLECLIEENVRYIFGNPGSTEAPLVDRLSKYPQIEYILTLHEGVAVGMADAYSLASGHVGVVNLHVAPGLGNGLGMIFNAYIGRSPLVITAGQQDSRARLREPLLFHDLVGMASPVTKWSVEVESADELPLILHRAFKVAKDPPCGPVFISLPIDIMEQETEKSVIQSRKIVRTSSINQETLEELGRILVEASNPTIIFGEEVYRSSAQDELVSLAELLGASVWSTMIAIGTGFPTSHAQYRGELPDTHQDICDCLDHTDCVLLVGGDFFKEVFYVDQSPFPEHAKIVHIETSPDRIARNFPVHLGIAADLRLALRELVVRLGSMISEEYRIASESRRQELHKLKLAAQTQQKARISENWDQSPISPARLMAEINNALPSNAVIVGETLTLEPDLFNTIYFDNPGDYFGSRGGGIGQGLPGAIGVQLAYPNRKVIALSGDGSALFSIQALWTAAHYQIPVLFIILNNRGYKILKGNLNRYRRMFGVQGGGSHPFADISDPHVNFVSLAKGFGIPGQMISNPQDIAPALKKALVSEGPYLLDIVISEA